MLTESSEMQGHVVKIAGFGLLTIEDDSPMQQTDRTKVNSEEVELTIVFDAT